MNNSTYTILIVDDFAVDRELYRRVLLADSSRTYRMLEAESVSEGLALCKSQKIDAILLDYALPDANGLEFLETLSAQSDRHIPPTIVLTGQGNESIAARASELGAQDYLLKRDFTPELLRLSIRKTLENAHLRQQLQYYQDKEVQVERQAAKQQTIEIWESMTDAYMTLDRDWRIIYANQAATQAIDRQSSRSPAEFLGKTHWEVFPWSIGTIFDREFRRAMTEQVAVHFEAFSAPARAWFEIHAYPATAGIGIYFWDITDRKRNQLELEVD